MQVRDTVAPPWFGLEVDLVVYRDVQAGVEGSDGARDAGIVKVCVKS